MNEQDLIKALASGNELAFRELILQQQERVWHVCYGFVKHAEDAEDVSQEVFVEVFRNIRKFDGKSSLGTWIYRIAVNRSLDHLKSKKRKKRFAKVLSIFGQEETQHLEANIQSAKPDQPDDLLHRKQQQEMLDKALDNIPENQATAFRLSKIDGMSNKEAAEIMNLSVSAIEALMHRAKKGLREELIKLMHE